MNSRTLLWRDLLVLFGLTGWALALPAHASEFAVSMALTCLMYVALSSSWGFFCGASRYLSLATSAFFGIGAYCTAVMLGEWSWVGVILLGAGLATLVAVLPLKQTVPYLVYVDKATGVTQVVDVATPSRITQDEVHARHWVTRYVQARERYVYQLLQDDYPDPAMEQPQPPQPESSDDSQQQTF